MKILAVTVLTSYDDNDLIAAGYGAGVSETVKSRALKAREIGVDGLVCSPNEAAMLRPLIGPDILLVTPGMRPAGAVTGDQKRIMTPAAAIAAGADHLVVGRPIVEARSKGCREAIVSEIAEPEKIVKQDVGTSFREDGGDYGKAG